MKFNQKEWDNLKNASITKLFQEASKLRKLLPSGTLIQLIQMNEEKYPVLPGTYGIVNDIDDMCQIHVRWESGSGLALIPGIDKFTVIGRVFANLTGEDENNKYLSEKEMETYYEDCQKNGCEIGSFDEFLENLYSSGSFKLCDEIQEIPSNLKMKI